MYQFTDKGENDVCLRPEGTAGVVRHFVEKKLDSENYTTGTNQMQLPLKEATIELGGEK